MRISGGRLNLSVAQQLAEELGDRRPEGPAIDERAAHTHILAKVREDTADRLDLRRRMSVDGVRDPPHDARAGDVWEGPIVNGKQLRSQWIIRYADGRVKEGLDYQRPNADLEPGECAAQQNKQKDDAGKLCCTAERLSRSEGKVYAG